MPTTSVPSPFWWKPIPNIVMTHGAILAFYIGPPGVLGGVKTGMLSCAKFEYVPADLDRRRRQAAAVGRTLSGRKAGRRSALPPYHTVRDHTEIDPDRAPGHGGGS